MRADARRTNTLSLEAQASQQGAKSVPIASLSEFLSKIGTHSKIRNMNSPSEFLSKTGTHTEEEEEGRIMNSFWKGRGVDVSLNCVNA